MRMFIEFEDKLYEKVEHKGKGWGCRGTCDLRDSEEDERGHDGCYRFQRQLTCSDIHNAFKVHGSNSYFGWKEVI